MKKIILSVFVIGSFAGYALYQHKNSSISEYLSTDNNSSNQNNQNSGQNNSGSNESLSDNRQTAETLPSQGEKTISTKYSGDDDSEDEQYGSVNTSQGTNAVTSASSKASTPQPVTTPSKTVTPTKTTTAGMYKDGSYTGSVADAYYGNVQVKAVISGGKLSDVVFLSYPNDRQNSVRINTYATPILKSEAISAQSADVDAVSGASFTSKAFKESLSNALLQAKA